jgi:glyoxylase-like metal-dependent hydrolase (beta-lactamase superfamily II)
MNSDIQDITKNLFLIVGENNGRFPWSHSFLIQDAKNVIIDTGCGIETLLRIEKNTKIDFTINSHCHPDHSAGNWVFENTPLHVPQIGAESHGRKDLLSERLAEPGKLAGIWQKYVTEQLRFQDKAPTNFYSDGDIFNFGHCRLQAIHTPGHTADHFCFFEPEHEVLLCFDLDMTSFGPWYGHRESNLDQLRSSLKKIRQLAPKILASSHRDIITENIPQEIDRFEAVLDFREEKLFSLMEKGISFHQLVDLSPIYGGRPYQQELLTYWEGEMIKKHLEEMTAKGLIHKKDNNYFSIK